MPSRFSVEDQGRPEPEFAVSEVQYNRTLVSSLNNKLTIFNIYLSKILKTFLNI